MDPDRWSKLLLQVSLNWDTSLRSSEKLDHRYAA